jgi:hypothetical protein
VISLLHYYRLERIFLKDFFSLLYMKGTSENCFDIKAIVTEIYSQIKNLYFRSVSKQYTLRSWHLKIFRNNITPWGG